MAKKAVKKRVEKVETKKEEIKNENKRLLSYKITAILYFVCGACWIISAILSIIAHAKYIFDIVFGIIFIIIGILYLMKDKKDNKK